MLNKKTVWNKNFLLLWQGSIVSAFGDTIYGIALGFWILDVTGSTALMGTLMAVTSLPKIILGPFAGVWVDRLNRKWILVLMDLIRGLVIIAVAITALLGVIEIWMVFTAGMILGLCTAYFYPASSSVIPDLVSKEELQKANSLFSMIQPISGILGNGGGGFLYTLLGAPLLFLTNGISYIVSAISEIFIDIPKVKSNSKKSFFKDMEDGIKFIWDNLGIRFLILLNSVANFFFGIALILILPLFKTNAFLGAGKYGIFIGCFTIGGLLGFIIIGSYKITSKNRFSLFVLSTILMISFFIAIPLCNNFILMIVFGVLGAGFNSVENVIVGTTLQEIIPQNMRGKVFSLVGTVMGGLSPISMAIGGILGEYYPIKWVIAVSLIIALIISIFLCLSNIVKNFLKQDFNKTIFDNELIKENA